MYIRFFIRSSVKHISAGEVQEATAPQVGQKSVDLGKFYERTIGNSSIFSACFLTYSSINMSGKKIYSPPLSLKSSYAHGKALIKIQIATVTCLGRGLLTVCSSKVGAYSMGTLSKGANSRIYCMHCKTAVLYSWIF